MSEPAVTHSEAPARIDMRDLVSDLEQAVRSDSASYERGNGRQLREVGLARGAIVTEYDALRQRYEEAIEALRKVLWEAEDFEPAQDACDTARGLLRRHGQEG